MYNIMYKGYNYVNDSPAGGRIRFQGQLHQDVGAQVSLSQRQRPRQVEHSAVAVRDRRKVRKRPRKSHLFEHFVHRFVSGLIQYFCELKTVRYLRIVYR